MCFVFIWEQTATCAPYSINWLVFITEMKSVYCAVRTGSLNKAVCASYLDVGSVHRDDNNSDCRTYLYSRYSAHPHSFIAFRGNLLHLDAEIRQCQVNKGPRTYSSYRFTLWHLWWYKRKQIWRENWQRISKFVFPIYRPWFLTPQGQADNGRDDDCQMRGWAQKLDGWTL